VLALLLLALPLQAATPREELLRLVPDGMGFCLVVQDLRGQAAAVQASPFAAQLSRSPLGEKIRGSGELKKLDRLEAKMKEKIGLDWAQLRDDILGDALVLAYRPGPPGKPEEEQGLILLRARNAKVLADLIERVNTVQKEEGDLKDVEERRHNGSVYYRRLPQDKRAESDKPPEFYYVNGPVLVLSSQETMLRQAIDLDRTRPAEAVSEPSRRLRELGAERAFLAVWINPRAFDSEMQGKIANAPKEQAVPAKQFALYWKALDSVVLSLATVERDVNLSLGMRARVKELPPAAQKLFREAATPSDLWRRFPDSALLALGSRLDGAALLDLLGGFLTAENRQAMDTIFNRQLGALLGEEDFARDLLPGLGPDWGLCVTAPAPGDKSWMPQTLFALRVDTSRAKKTLERKLSGALDFGARLVVFGHNSQHPDQPMKLKSIEMEGQEVRYLASERGLPPGITPAYGLVGGYLLLSSSLESLSRYARPTLSPAPAADASFPLLRLSLKDWRAYLREHRDGISEFLAEQNKVSRDAAGGQVDAVIAGLQFIDRIELRQRSAPGQVSFTLSVQLTAALKK
jgi:hypothetical protein